MHEKIHIKLTLFCTFILSAILALLTLGYLYVAERNLRISSDASFLTTVITITSSLENQSTISSNWILQTEQNNDIIFYLLDNHQLTYHATAMSDEKKELILHFIASCKAQGLVNESDYSTYPTHIETTYTDSFANHYHGAYLFVPKTSGCIEAFLLSSNQTLEQQIHTQRLMFLFLDLAALVVFFLFFWFFIQKLLEPIYENQRRQVQFIENASHELRSPLAVILSNVSALKRADDSEKESFYQAVSSEGNRMAGLINSMLRLARSDLSKQEVIMEPLELDTLIMDCYENYESLFLDKKVSLILSLPFDAFPTIKSNGARITEVIGILLSNALSYTSAGGTVTLSLATHGGKVHILVADTGIGIPDSEKEQVFDRFYRGCADRKGEPHYGLGLSIASQLIKELNGTIKLTDTEGGGSTFTLSFPFNS